MQQPRMAPESGWSNACCSSGAVRVMWAYDMVDRYSMYVVGGNEGEKRQIQVSMVLVTSVGARVAT